MFAATGDVRFRDRANYIIAELEACQQANGNGYVAAISAPTVEATVGAALRGRPLYLR
jgi:hypothetical protein